MRLFHASLGIALSALILPFFAAHAEELQATSAPTSEPSVAIFQMADGRFFHPGTGIIGVSEEEVRRLVTGGTVPSASDTGVTSPDDQAAQDSAVQAPLAPDPLVVAVRQARETLSADIRTDAETKRVTKTQEEWRPVTLAIWDSHTQEIQYVKIERKGNQIRTSAAVDARYPHLKMVRSNGVNSAFQVDNDGRYFVVALRHPVLRAMNSKKTLFSIEDVVYTPYSKSLHTAAMVVEGEEYLDTLVTSVFDALRAEGVKSRAYPDRLLVDVIDPAMVKAIAAIEHLGEDAMEDDTKRALEQFFVILGGNQGSAYIYSRSSAGALGLVQFIPSTYTALARRSNGTLDADFERAMSSHATAIRAQVMYLDILLTEFPSDIREQFATNPERINEYVVAAYNGGSGRVRRAVDIWDQVLSGEKSRQLAKLKRDYEAAFNEAERLRKATLKEKDSKKRAASQKKLDAQRVTYRTLKAQVDRLEAALLRPETIGYVEKYRLAKADERFSHRQTGIGVTSAGTVVQPAAALAE